MIQCAIGNQHLRRMYECDWQKYAYSQLSNARTDGQWIGSKLEKNVFPLIKNPCLLENGSNADQLTEIIQGEKIVGYE